MERKITLRLTSKEVGLLAKRVAGMLEIEFGELPLKLTDVRLVILAVNADTPRAWYKVKDTRLYKRSPDLFKRTVEVVEISFRDIS